MYGWLLYAAVSLSACSSSHPGLGDGSAVDAPGGDGGLSDGTLGDGGAVDATHPCGYRAGHPNCGPTCPEGCPGGPFDMVCVEELGVCATFGDSCFYVDSDPLSPEAEFCAGGEFCVPVWEGSLYRGRCYSAELCLADALECVYYDRTPLIEGPPVDDVVCPSPEWDYCGPACGYAHCQVPDTGDSFSRVSCIGVSEERAIGICAYETEDPCTPLGFDDRDCRLLLGERCACIATRGPEPPTMGWLTRRADCLAYRAMYPDSFHCLDETWTVIE